MRPYIKKTIETYDKMASHYKDRRSALIMYDLIDRLIALMMGDELLEIGSGPGRDARVFADKGLHVTGMDLSSSLVEIARKDVPEASFLVGDVLDMPFSDATYHGIWTCATLHHLKKEDLPLALNEMFRVLKPGAPAFISVKGGEGEYFKLDLEFEGNERFFAYYKQDEFEKFLKDAGFELVDIWTESTEDRFGKLHPNFDRIYVRAFVRKPL